MDDEKSYLPDVEGTISEIAAILARGWLRLNASRHAPVGERVSQDDVRGPEDSDPSSEKGLDYSGPRSLPGRALTPGERRRKGG